MAPKSTPMMEQYQAIKRQNPDSLLFFRLGDFYELFGDDAKEASNLLNITLTSRSSGEGRSVRVPMAGVPYHAAPLYIQKLLKSGKKIAICEQMETPKEAKGALRRELVRVITPGTALEEGFLDSRSNNYLLALFRSKKGLGLAAVDNASGDFFCSEIEDEELEGELARIQPSEILLCQGQEFPEFAASSLKTELEPFSYFDAEAILALKAHFKVSSLEGFGVLDSSAAAQAAAALLAYLKRTQKSPLSHITDLRNRQRTAYLRLDAAAQKHLELSENQEDGGKVGTLFELLDRCASPGGARSLKRWIHSPLMSIEEIRLRQDAIEEFLQDPLLRATLGHLLGQISDMERALARIGCQAANARDLSAIRQTLGLLPEIQKLLDASRAGLLKSWQSLDLCPDLQALLERALLENPPLSIKEGGMIRPGYSEALDLLVADSHGGRDLVLAVQQKERDATGNTKLRVQFNSIFGFYIEISKAQLDTVPPHYERKQTLVNAERFTTPELKAIESRVLSADERRKEMESKLFEALREKVALEAKPLLDLAKALAELDSLLSLAIVAHDYAYVRPELLPEAILEIEGARHPVLESKLRREGLGRFVENDCRLSTQEQQVMLITGPNMAGKSTYMRQVALISLLGQMGSFVPARKARLGLVDRLFTRVGASDRQNRGMSTFLVEMTETANILRHASPHSLVILDEIGRGTSTYDGVSIAWAVAAELHENPKLACRTLFATHYFELTELEKSFPRIHNYCVAVREEKGQINFLHEIRKGSSEHSYGIAVARLAGVPEAVLKEARKVLASLEAQRESQAPGEGPNSEQLNIFQGLSKGDEEAAELRKELQSLDLDQISPLQALNWLVERKARGTSDPT